MLHAALLLHLTFRETKPVAWTDATTLYAFVMPSIKSRRELISVPLKEISAEAHAPDFSGIIGYLRVRDEVYYGLVLDQPTASGGSYLSIQLTSPYCLHSQMGNGYNSKRRYDREGGTLRKRGNTLPHQYVSE